MPNMKKTDPLNGHKINNNPSHGNKHQRLSLQQKHTELDLTPSALRHTQSHRYESDGKKKTKKAVFLSPIPSTISETSEEEAAIGEKKKNVRTKNQENGSRTSKSSNASKASYAIDNLAYDSHLDGRSISSTAGSSRQPSVLSLEVVREQYCCFAKRTKCERRLLVTVVVMSTTIIVLVVVLVAISTDSNLKAGLKEVFKL